MKRWFLLLAMVWVLLGWSVLSVAVSQEKITITWWYEQVTPENLEAMENNIVKPFEAMNPNVDVEIVVKMNLLEVLRTAVVAGEGPDIIMTMGPAEANRYAKGGFLLPLDNFVAEAGLDKELPALALDVGRVEGKIYSLPKTFESMGIIYNKSLFDEFGWKPPTNRDEWVALCEAAKAKGILPVAGGNVAWRPTNEHYVTVYINHYPGPEVVYEALTGQRSWEDPLFVEAIDMFKNDFLAYWPEFGLYSTLDAPDFVPMVATRKAAMLVVGSWAFQWLVDPAYWPSEDKWGWAPFPSLREGVEYPFVDIGIGTTLSVNKNSKHPEETARFLVWMLSNKEMIAKMLRDFPGEWIVPIDIPAELVPPEVDPVFFEHVDTQNDLMRRGAYGYTTWTFLGPEAWQWCYEGIEEVWFGKISAQEYMKKWNEIFQKELQAGVVPPVPARKK